MDLVVVGNDIGVFIVMVLDGEGEFYSCFCDVCLGSIDKELKVGVVVMGSVLIVLGIFW